MTFSFPPVLFHLSRGVDHAISTHQETSRGTRAQSLSLVDTLHIIPSILYILESTMCINIPLRRNMIGIRACLRCHYTWPVTYDSSLRGEIIAVRNTKPASDIL